MSDISSVRGWVIMPMNVEVGKAKGEMKNMLLLQ